MITTLCIAVGTGSEARSCGHVVVPLCGGLQSEATLLSGSRCWGLSAGFVWLVSGACMRSWFRTCAGT